MHVKTKTIQALAAACLIGGSVFASAPKPAGADDTTTLLLGAAAIAGVAIIENVRHKQQMANTIVGYTPQGYPVYADGHVGYGSAQAGTAGLPTIGCTQGQTCHGTYVGNNEHYGGRNTLYDDGGYAHDGYGRPAADHDRRSY